MEDASRSIIGILCPVRGTVSYVWCMNARNLEIPVNWAWHGSSGFPIDVSRDHLVELALKDGVQYVFFWDTDVLVPQNILSQLLSLYLPIASGLYFAKTRNPCAYKKLPNGKIRPLTKEEVDSAPIMEVDAVGGGCLLIDARVFKVVPKPWFKWELDPDAPEDEQIGKHSEDIYFCLKAKRYGFPTYLVSAIKCKHVLETEYAIDEKGEFTPII
jgi:hypothetical protein